MCLDVPLSAYGEGSRAELGEFLGLGAACRLPVPDEVWRAGDNVMKSNNKIKDSCFRLRSGQT